MKNIPANNGRINTLNKWRQDMRLKALGAATCRGGTISGREIAPLLGVSQRALRILLVNDGFFTIKYDINGQAWFTISPSTIQPNIKLISHASA
jgi:hypothetical protein